MDEYEYDRIERQERKEDMRAKYSKDEDEEKVIEMKEKKRMEWKEKFEAWFQEQVSRKIPKTEDNPNGVAIGCNLYPNDKSHTPMRRYKKVE